jgi:hypothetical protein
MCVRSLRMTDIRYTLRDGVYTFPTELEAELHLKNVQRDGFGRLHADARFVTRDGAVLALAHGDLMSGPWRRDLAQQVAKRNSGDPTRWENVVIAAVVALESDPNVLSQVVPVAKPRLVPAAQFLAEIPPPRPQVVQEIGERGHLLAVVAKPKVAKSLLTLGLAVAVGTGIGTWLGRTVAPGRAAVFQLEDSPRTIGRRLKAMLGNSSPEHLLIHRPEEPFRISEDNYPLVVDACRECSLIVVDPIIQASRVGDWNSQQEVRNAYELWRRLARELDALVIVVAHHRKALGDFGEQIAGSIQGLATPDGIIEIRRDLSLTKTQRRVSYVGRDWADTEDEVIDLDTSTLTYTVVGTSKGFKEERRQKELEDLAGELEQFLPLAPPGLTFEELREKSGEGEKAVRSALKLLKEGGRLVTTGKLRSKTNPARYHRVQQENPHT